MIETLQLEEAVEVRDDMPKFLVEWTPRWHQFVTSIRPALARSNARLAGEAPFGLVPYRISIPAYVLEALLIFAVIAVRNKIEELRPIVAPRTSTHEVIYYSGDELPRTEDLGGSEAGRTGEAGGEEAHHRTQTIKIARGGTLAPQVVDAPNLKLPSSRDAVANLLAIRPDPGPPPSEGMRSSRKAPNLQTPLIAPSPDVLRDYTRNGVAMDQVIAPAPSLDRSHTPTAPNLSAGVIPPAATVARENALVAPLLVPAVVPPAPSVSGSGARNAPSLSASVVAPAPDVTRDKMRSAPTVGANVIPPAPGSLSRDVSRAPVRMMDPSVVPPPVSSPERATTGNPKLTLPAPAVIAPPPSNDVSQDVRHLASGTPHDPFRAVVPPPPSSGGGSLMSSLIGKIMGPSEVVQPPPAVEANGAKRGAPALAANVVAPPASVGTGAGAANPRGSRNAGSLDANVIAPPSASGVSGGAGSRASSAPLLGPQNVVAPPPSLSGPGGGTGSTAGGAGAPSGTSLANNIVPPPPAVGGGTGTNGSGLGRKGPGLGSPTDIGSNVAAANTGGSTRNAGAVISSDPGSKVGLPSTGGPGALAMSPAGGEKAGLGGSGGGTGIGRGSGPGSGVTGEGIGASKAGPGRGSDPNARGGISPKPGTGGAGNAAAGTPPVPGVSVNGGSVTVSFDSAPSPADADPSNPKRSTLKQSQALDTDIVSTASAAGAFAPYKNLLRGEKHTRYVNTLHGMVVMEYADEGSAGRYSGPLLPPSQIRAEMPDNLPPAEMIVACKLDTNGDVRNVRVLEAGSADMTAKIVAALSGWKFRPATRGGQPVEVTAILGFNINTNDRF